ncbi:MAG: invasion associated locus B family protein [Pseudomonadota bacterium]
MKKLVTALALSIALAGTALAQSPTRISQFNAWGAYSYNAPTGKVCYILSLPTRKEPSNVDHGDIFFLISQRPGQNVSYEPQAMMGYPLQEDSKVTVNVDGRNYVLFTKGDSAWVENAAEEPALVSAMRAGSTMTVSATSRRGTNTTYTFSLSGVTAALNEIQNCN